MGSANPIVNDGRNPQRKTSLEALAKSGKKSGTKPDARLQLVAKS